jgi:hypothetical protein
VTISSPADGSRFPVDSYDEASGIWTATVTLSAFASDPDDEPKDLRVEWESSVDGPLGVGHTLRAGLSVRGCSDTDHTIWVTAIDPDGAAQTDQITVITWTIC